MDSIPPEVAATGASLVLICRDPAPRPTPSWQPADGLFARLRRGQVPPWLETLWTDPAGYVLYEVRP